MTDSRHDLGVEGERLAAEHLERLGYEILARRHRTRFGELDLVAADDSAIVFVEVKARRAGGATGVWDAITADKAAQVRRMAAAWLAQVTDRPRRTGLRFDAVGVVVDGRGRLLRLDHLEDAF